MVLKLSNQMIKTLPLFLRKSHVYKEIFNAQGNQFNALETDINDVRKQMDVNTATWGLDIYEKELGIKTDRSKPFDERRSVVKSKMRGSGKVDSLLLKVVADSYTNGDCVVSFNGAIIITFNSQIGRPPNLNDLKNAIDDVKPAHLRVEYEFRYLSVSEVHHMSIGQLHNKELSNFAGGA